MTGPFDSTRATAVVAPPWTLFGRGLVCVARTVDGRHGFLGFFRYLDSPVGAYDEVLWVPRVRPPHQITAIRVSTPASLTAGRENWGIPKALAAFEWEENGNHWAVNARDADSGEVFALAEANVRGPRVPLGSGFLPAGLRRFDQAWAGKHYRFAPSARGRFRVASLTATHLEGAGFPSLAGVLGAFVIEDLRLELPAPEIGGSAG